MAKGEREYTAAEIARALGITERSVRRRGEKEGWPFREENGGQKRFYGTLPPEVRQALAVWELRKGAETSATPGEEEAPGQEIKEWLVAGERERAVARARLAVLRVQEDWLARKGGDNGRRTRTLREFHGRLNKALRAVRGISPSPQPSPPGGEGIKGLLDLGFREHEIPEVLERVRRVSWQTTYRWQSRWRSTREKRQGSGVAGLVRQYQAGPGIGARTMTPDMKALVRTLIVKGEIKLFPGKAAGGPLVSCNRTLLHKRLKENFPRVPHPAHFNRWINHYLEEEGEGLAAICLPSWWRANCAPKGGLASEGVEYFGQCWELDATRADVMLSDGRHELVAAVDLYSRDALVEVEKDATSLTVAKLLRQGLLAWGVPEKIITDRGLIFKNKHILTASAQLGIDLELCEAYAPWQKPHVEAFFGSLARVLFEALPWYIGHNPAQRKRIEEYHRFQQVFYHRKAVKLSCEATAAELWEVMGHWLAKVYRAEPHRFKDCKAGRPARVWQRQAQTPRRAPRVGEAGHLDLLLAPAFERTYQSGVAWESETYQPDSVEAWQAAQKFARRKVIFKPSLADLGKGSLWERREDGSAGDFICLLDSRLRGGLELEEYMRAKKRIIKAHKRRRQEAEQLCRPPGYDRQLARMALPKVAVAGFGAPDYAGEAYQSLLDYGERYSLRLVADPARDEQIARGAAALEEARRAGEQDLEALRADLECRRYEELVRREAKGELVTGDEAQFMRFFEAGEKYHRLAEHFREVKLAAATEVWGE